MFRHWFMRILGLDELSELSSSVRRCRQSLNITSDRLTKYGETLKAYDQLVNNTQPLRDAVNTLEGAGIRRKFGNVIDIDYDRFLNALGPSGEAELARTIDARLNEVTGGAASIVQLSNGAAADTE